VSVGQEGSLRVWDVRAKRCVLTVPLPVTRGPDRFVLAADGRTFAFSCGHEVYVWTDR
jgi:hypothetical protein